MEKEIRFIDLFAGIGGFRIALESQGAECVFSSEWDKFAQETYAKNFGEIPKGDITLIKEEEIPIHDILCGGFPCQPFSISGKQKGFEDTRGTLFFHIARIAKYHKPKVLFLENVKNFARHNNGQTLLTVLKVLDDLGYDVYTQILKASDFGIPTVRERFFIVGFRRDLNIKSFNFPKPSNQKVFLKDFLEKNIDPNEYEIIRSDIKMTKEDSLETRDKPIQIGKINKGGQGERIYSINGHAITLSANGGGAASKTGAYLIDGKIRKLTPKECANIMGFPTNFIIPVSKAQAYKQFGNSVAVPVVKKVAEEILNALNSN